MGILFDFYETPSPTGEEGQVEYHARPILNGRVGTEKLVEIIHGRSSSSRGDILSILRNLSQVLFEQLQEGKRVHIDGVGYFSVTLRCAGKIMTREDMRADRVGVNTVKFRIDKRMKNGLRQVKTERIKLDVHSARLSVEEIDERLATYFNESPILTRRSFQLLCGMTQVTAFRHIHRLLEEGKIKNINTPRNPVYVPGENAVNG